MDKNTKYFLNTTNKEEERFPNAVLRTYFVAFNLTNFVFDYKVAFSLSVRVMLKISLIFINMIV